MAQSTAWTPYRPGQGVYARSAAAAAMLMAALFGSWRLYNIISAGGEAARKVALLGMKVPPAALYAGGAFVAIGVVVFLLTFGLETGIKAIDGKTHALIDLLVDTEGELAKVSWPDSDELSVSTTAVLVSVVLLGVFLLCADWLIALVMRTAGVLPR